MSPERPVGLRAVAREAIRAEVATHAVDLFHRKGYDETTIDDICVSAAISSRSFFRYFASKEEVVLGDVAKNAETLMSAVRDRPSGEDAWTLMRHGLHAVLAAEVADREGQFFRAMTVICQSPALMAGYSQKHLSWVQLVSPALVDRAGDGSTLGRFEAQTIVRVALSCLDAALVEWVEQSGGPLLSELLDRALAIPSPCSPAC